MPTEKFVITSAEWTAVSGGAKTVMIQLMTNGPLRVNKGEEPAANDLTGLILERSRGSEGVAFNDTLLEEVFLRAIDGEEEVVVIT